jgi:hypothetical protein
MFLEAFVTSSSAFPLLKHTREYIEEAPTGIYTYLLAPMLNRLPGAIADGMQSDGFSTIFNNDADTVRAVACLSLSCSLTGGRIAIAKIMREAGYDLEAILKVAEQTEKNYRIRLVVATEDQVLSFI